MPQRTGVLDLLLLRRRRVPSTRAPWRRPSAIAGRRAFRTAASSALGSAAGNSGSSLASSRSTLASSGRPKRTRTISIARTYVSRCSSLSLLSSSFSSTPAIGLHAVVNRRIALLAMLRIDARDSRQGQRRFDLFGRIGFLQSLVGPSGERLMLDGRSRGPAHEAVRGCPSAARRSLRRRILVAVERFQSPP